MPYSYNTTVASGTTSTVSVTFPYLDKAHVHVRVNGVLVADNTLVWPDDGVISLPSTPTVGAAVRVYRDTPKDANLVVFPESTGPMNARDLNRALLQQLYIAQENYDLGFLTQEQLDQTTEYINESLGAIEDSVAAAAASASAAAASATEAATYTGQAALAEAWANAPEDTDVGHGAPPGSRSAYHWAMNAAAIVLGDLDASMIFFSSGSGYGSLDIDNGFQWLMEGKANGGIPVLLYDTEPDPDPDYMTPATLTNQRIITDSTQITRDLTTDGEFKLNIVVATEAEAKAGTDALKPLTPATGAAAVEAAVRKLLCGTMFRVPAATPPPGSKVLNGALLNRADYPDLWAFAQASGNIVTDTQWSSGFLRSAFSTGDGSTTFRIPDRRGYFERNFNMGNNVDTGRDFISIQSDAIKSHTHSGSASGTLFRGGGSESGEGNKPQGANSDSSAANALSLTVTVGATGGSETRPINMTSLMCIWDGTVP